MVIITQSGRLFNIKLTTYISFICIGWATREMEYSVRKDDAQDLDISDYESESDSGDEEKEESSKKRQSTRKDASTT